MISKPNNEEAPNVKDAEKQLRERRQTRIPKTLIIRKSVDEEILRNEQFNNRYEELISRKQAIEAQLKDLHENVLDEKKLKEKKKEKPSQHQKEFALKLFQELQEEKESIEKEILTIKESKDRSTNKTTTLSSNTTEKRGKLERRHSSELIINTNLEEKEIPKKEKKSAFERMRRFTLRPNRKLEEEIKKSKEEH